MKPEDEKFLKDLVWSEKWFPWKNKRRVIFRRGDDSKSWERIALILSLLALIVSAVSAWGTLEQNKLTREQFVAADRNRALQTTFEDLLRYCAKVGRPPLKLERVSFRDKTGKILVFPLYTIQSLNAVSAEIEEKYFKDLDELYAKLFMSTQMLTQWLPGDEKYAAEDMRAELGDLFSPSL